MWATCSGTSRCQRRSRSRSSSRSTCPAWMSTTRTSSSSGRCRPPSPRSTRNAASRCSADAGREEHFSRRAARADLGAGREPGPLPALLARPHAPRAQERRAREGGALRAPHARGLGRHRRADRGRRVRRACRHGLAQHHRHRPPRALAPARGRRRAHQGHAAALVGLTRRPARHGRGPARRADGGAHPREDPSESRIGAGGPGGSRTGERRREHEPARPAYQLGGAKVLIDAGVIRPMRPDRLWGVLRTLQRWGRSPAAGAISLAERFPEDTMIVDELGTLTHTEVDTRTNALAHALSDQGIGEGDAVGIMCRNHRGFIEATIALSKLGADTLYLNTAFAGPQITEVVEREKPKALIFDEEFYELLE